MRQSRSTLLTLGALMFVLAGGPTFALCGSVTSGGCCCHDGKCPAQGQLEVQTCCGSDNGAPSPLSDMAPTSSPGPVMHVDCEPLPASGADHGSGWGFGLQRTAPPDPDPPPLYALHAAFLI